MNACLLPGPSTPGRVRHTCANLCYLMKHISNISASDTLMYVLLASSPAVIAVRSASAKPALDRAGPPQNKLQHITTVAMLMHSCYQVV